MYSLDNSPFKTELESVFQKISDAAAVLSQKDERTAVENALYMSVTKRMANRTYDNDKHAYLSGLLSDLVDAENEFEQVCYASSHASDAFFTIKGAIVSLLASE